MIPALKLHASCVDTTAERQDHYVCTVVWALRRCFGGSGPETPPADQQESLLTKMRRSDMDHVEPLFHRPPNVTKR